eukprot:Hpha_TRINITY_DN16593_c1_g2::TRINITY_DN16593_c1_g2_i1::g.132959::m.132959
MELENISGIGRPPGTVVAGCATRACIGAGRRVNRVVGDGAARRSLGSVAVLEEFSGDETHAVVPWAPYRGLVRIVYVLSGALRWTARHPVQGDRVNSAGTGDVIALHAGAGAVFKEESTAALASRYGTGDIRSPRTNRLAKRPCRALEFWVKAPVASLNDEPRADTYRAQELPKRSCGLSRSWDATVLFGSFANGEPELLSAPSYNPPSTSRAVLFTLQPSALLKYPAPTDWAAAVYVVDGEVEIPGLTGSFRAGTMVTFEALDAVPKVTVSSPRGVAESSVRRGSADRTSSGRKKIPKASQALSPRGVSRTPPGSVRTGATPRRSPSSNHLNTVRGGNSSSRNVMTPRTPRVTRSPGAPRSSSPSQPGPRQSPPPAGRLTGASFATSGGAEMEIKVLASPTIGARVLIVASKQDDGKELILRETIAGKTERDIESAGTMPAFAPFLEQLRVQVAQNEKLDSLSAAPSSRKTVSSKRLELWTRVKVLGQGAFGKVWSGMLPNGATVAVKEVTIDDSCGKEERSAFEAEFRLMQRLSHPNIVQYLGHLFSDEGTLLIFLEYVTGGSVAGRLKDILKHGAKRLPPVVTRNYTRQVLWGLEYLHADLADKHPVIHRDIKGDNLLLSTKGEVKLADFGASKMMGNIGKGTDELAATMVGTPYWMAPEVISPDEHGYGTKCDIWSLGCVVVEMYGALPWADQAKGNAWEIMLAVSQATGPPSNIPSDLPPALNNFLYNCCFHREPYRRWAATALLRHPYILCPDEELDPDLAAFGDGNSSPSPTPKIEPQCTPRELLASFPQIPTDGPVSPLVKPDYDNGGGQQSLSGTGQTGQTGNTMTQRVGQSTRGAAADTRLPMADTMASIAPSTTDRDLPMTNGAVFGGGDAEEEHVDPTASSAMIMLTVTDMPAPPPRTTAPPSKPANPAPAATSLGGECDASLSPRAVQPPPEEGANYAQVCDYLQSLHLTVPVELSSLEENGIDGACLRCFTADDVHELYSVLEVTKFGDKKKLTRALGIS